MIKRISIYPLARAAPADDLTNPDDRVQAAQELKHYLEWPFEVEIETDEVTDVFYGHEARDFLRRWLDTPNADG